MERQDQDHYKLSTGRIFYANNGVIGLRPRDKTADFEFERGWHVFEGSDGSIDFKSLWTKEEKEELAEFMILLWLAFKNDKKEDKRSAAIGKTV